MLGKLRLMVSLVAFALCLIGGYFLFSDRSSFLAAADQGFFHRSDNSTKAILDRNDVVKLSENAVLNDAIEQVLTAPRERPMTIDFNDGNGPIPDVTAWKTVKRNYDDVSIRFGETIDCDRALVMDDDQIICDEKLYLQLFDAIDLAIAQLSK